MGSFQVADLDWKVLLIGGHSGAGKTIAARRPWPVSWNPLDDGRRLEAGIRAGPRYSA